MTGTSGRVADRTALVTGAGSGFGAAMARLFADEGARVVVNDINEKAGEQVASDIRGSGGEALFVGADVTDGDAVRAMFEAAVDAFGGVDVLVNNAGYPQWNGPMTEVSEADFDRIFDVNVKSVFHTSVHGVPVLRRSSRAVILHIASTAAIRPRPGLVWYNASKAAVASLTYTMAQELAPEIRVNALCPVATDTPMLESFMGGATPEKRAQFIATVPLGRLGRPMDVAKAAVFLASDDAEFITGVLLPVDGGRCAT
jgi:3-oxoacyl-[acyl-carrier protein] reductase